tara:strand:+ start:2426 stop:2626 length:201 start_codon:yes stop_codon:yes gene_type:complete
VYIFIEKKDSVYYFGGLTMNFLEELEKETQAMLKQINIRKIEKTKKAKERIGELKQLIKFWEEEKN